MVKTGDNMILKEMITGNNDRLKLKRKIYKTYLEKTCAKTHP